VLAPCHKMELLPRQRRSQSARQSRATKWLACAVRRPLHCTLRSALQLLAKRGVAMPTAPGLAPYWHPEHHESVEMLTGAMARLWQRQRQHLIRHGLYQWQRQVRLDVAASSTPSSSADRQGFNLSNAPRRFLCTAPGPTLLGSHGLVGQICLARKARDRMHCELARCRPVHAIILACFPAAYFVGIFWPSWAHCRHVCFTSCQLKDGTKPVASSLAV